MEEAAGCGVVLLATAHGSSREELRQRPVYRRMLAAGIFSRFVEIGLVDGRRVYRVREGTP